MRKIEFIIILMGFSLISSNKLSLQQNANNATGNMQRFDMDLFKQVSLNNTNVVVSPFSIFSVLALAANGANGKTMNEMSKFLDKTTQLSRLNLLIKRSNDFLQLLENDKDSDLKLANGIFMKMKPSTYILSVARVYYRARIEQIQNADQINAFVSNTTNSKIMKIVDQMTVESAKLILVNAIYFKAAWMNPFENTKNSQGIFKLDELRSINCTYMNQKFAKGKVSYYEDEDTQMIRLPYKNLKLHAYILLPRKLKLMNYLDKLNSISLKMFERKLDSKTEVLLTLPRFKVNFEANMKDALMQMGMKIPFTNEADFTRLTQEKASLMIDKILHKTFLEVSESGTEAAAATAAVMNLTSSPPEPDNANLKKMVVDRPFMFFIKHDEADQMLFMSKVEDF